MLHEIAFEKNTINYLEKLVTKHIIFLLNKLISQSNKLYKLIGLTNKDTVNFV
jgi:hypothetical protein